MTVEAIFQTLFDCTVTLLMGKESMTDESSKHFLWVTLVLLSSLCLFTAVFMIVFAKLDAHVRSMRYRSLLTEQNNLIGSGNFGTAVISFGSMPSTFSSFVFRPISPRKDHLARYSPSSPMRFQTWREALD